MGVSLRKSETVTLVTLESAPREEVVETVPVVGSIKTVWNPFCERTGPEKVVLLMATSSCKVAVLCRHVRLAGTSQGTG